MTKRFLDKKQIIKGDINHYGFERFLFNNDYSFLLQIAIILLSTKLLGLLTKRISLPQVVGALAAGIVLGPMVLNVVQRNDLIVSLAELGVIPPDAISLFGNLEPLLLVIMGGMLSGVGIYMCFRQGGSTGGTDIVALLINKYHPINYGRVVLVTDSLIICASLLVGNGIETVIYGFLLTAVFGLSTDALLAGNQQSNQILVISHEHDRIAAEIVEKAHRGVTMLNGMDGTRKSRRR